jgi:hypothetical protein
LETQDTLLTFAELAVALAGFAGIVTVFQSRGRTWSAVDTNRLWMMLSFALATLVFSLLPLAWLLAGRSPWLVCSGLLGCFAVVQGFRSSLTLYQRPPGYNLYLVAFVATGGLSAAVVQFFNVLGLVFRQGFTGYFLGLLWLVVGAAFFFARLVYVGMSDAHGKGSPDA